MGSVRFHSSAPRTEWKECGLSLTISDPILYIPYPLMNPLPRSGTMRPLNVCSTNMTSSLSCKDSGEELKSLSSTHSESELLSSLFRINPTHSPRDIFPLRGFPRSVKQHIKCSIVQRSSIRKQSIRRLRQEKKPNCAQKTLNQHRESETMARMLIAYSLFLFSKFFSRFLLLEGKCFRIRDLNTPLRR